MYLIILITPCVILSHAHDKVENRDKGSNGVWIPSEHEVAKADVIICRNMTCRYTSEWRLEKLLAHINRKWQKTVYALFG